MFNRIGYTVSLRQGKENTWESFCSFVKISITHRVSKSFGPIRKSFPVRLLSMSEQYSTSLLRPNPGGRMQSRIRKSKLAGYAIKDSITKLKRAKLIETTKLHAEPVTHETEKVPSQTSSCMNHTGNDGERRTNESKKSRNSIGRKLSSLFKTKNSSNHSKSSKNSTDNSKNST